MPAIDAELSSERDNYADGIIEQRISRTYDENGCLTIEETEIRRPNETSDTRETHTCGDNDDVTIYERDDGNDGTIDSRTTWGGYDLNGHYTFYT